MLKMKDRALNLLETRTLEHFKKICEIPHGSFNEKTLSDTLCCFAQSLGLTCLQDEHNNVIVYKPAAPGYEMAAPVLLQAHIDMVCEKIPGCTVDFTNDPIPWQIEGDIISTGGKTTLGADDGIGVAMIMALLEAQDLALPPIEAAFTTAEEEDLSGALNIEGSLFSARKMINIDHGVDSEVVLGSCGGTGAELAFAVERAPAEEQSLFLEIRLTGLPGGHSGENINSGHGNAIILLNRLLLKLAAHGLRICDLKGGSFRTAIPREAMVSAAFPSASKETVFAEIEKSCKEFQEEYGFVAPQLRLEPKLISETPMPLTAATTAKLLSAVALSPNGIAEMSGKMPGVVESSDNLGELHLDEERCRLVYEIRAAALSERLYIEERIRLLAEILKASFNTSFAYPAWTYNPDSELKRLSNEVYKEAFGSEQKNVVLHAGLECACFCEKLPGLEAISVGPDMWALHSPTERLSLSSVRKSVCFIAELLERLAQEK